jgi:hypothetical protein
MPLLNGTGPRGLGPRSGRGMGKCGVFASLCDARRPPGRIFLFLAATVVGVVAKDAMNPKGITRKVFRSLVNRFDGHLQEPEADGQRTIRTEDAEVLPGVPESK